MKNFYKVWISSIDHLNSFTFNYKKQSIWRKMLGFFTIPQGSPYFSYAKFIKLLSMFVLFGSIFLFFRTLFLSTPIYVLFPMGVMIIWFSFVTIRFFGRLPVIFFSRGTLCVEKEKISFAANQPKLKNLYQLKNVNVNLNFQLKWNKIITIDQYESRDSPSQTYDLKWVRIQTTENVLGGSFLLRFGSPVLIWGKFKRKNEEFFKTLVDFTV